MSLKIKELYGVRVFWLGRDVELEGDYIYGDL